MVLVIGLVSLPIFFARKINFNEYSNELICIFEDHIKGQSLSSYLGPFLLICVEHKRKYA